ncbi:MAG: HTH-type transcriptional regulator RutR [Pseudomonadota bacterium]|nr:HTH-type transcriptional regulator RutR [Pseudomonadota bacterium]
MTEKTAAGKTTRPSGDRNLSSESLRRRQRHNEKKRDAILKAALDVFSRYGLHGASMDQIASQADVSKTNLFYYFSSKEELYLSVMQKLLTLWLTPLSEFSAAQEPLDALKDYIRQKLRFSRDHQAESRLFCMEVMQGAPLLLPQLETSLRELVDAKAGVIREWINQGKLLEVNPYHLLISIWATTQHYADFSVQVQAVCGQTLDDAAFFDEALDTLYKLILSGITPD